jgi:hypothetical protein
MKRWLKKPPREDEGLTRRTDILRKSDDGLPGGDRCLSREFEETEATVDTFEESSNKKLVTDFKETSEQTEATVEWQDALMKK